MSKRKEKKDVSMTTLLIATLAFCFVISYQIGLTNKKQREAALAIELKPENRIKHLVKDTALLNQTLSLNLSEKDLEKLVSKLSSLDSIGIEKVLNIVITHVSQKSKP